MNEDVWPIVGAVFGTAALSLLVGSCVQDYRKSTPQAAEVTIVDKRYHPEHYVTSCSSDNHGVTHCSTTYVAPSWAITYEDATRRFGLDVSSGLYKALRLGDRKVLNYDLGGGYWGARYNERILLQAPPPER